MELEAEAGAEVEQASGMVVVREAVVPDQAEVNSAGMCLGYLKKRFITIRVLTPVAKLERIKPCVVFV